MRKQKVDIDKILTDYRESQKAFNETEQRRNRTFATTDEIVFRAAVSDVPSKACYKALAGLHEAFANVAATVQDISAQQTAARELEGKIAELAERDLDGATERIAADLKTLKDENEALAAGRAPG